jgi:hypothetical protein
MTPYLAALQRECQFRIEQEHREVEAGCAEPRRQLRMLRQRIADTDDVLADLHKQIGDMPPHPPGSQPPAPHQGTVPTRGPLPKEELERRRLQSKHEGKRRDLEESARALDVTLRALRVEAEGLAEAIAATERISAAATEQLREHTRLRMNVYLGGLVHEHAEREALNAYLQPFLSGQVDWLTTS